MLIVAYARVVKIEVYGDFLLDFANGRWYLSSEQQSPIRYYLPVPSDFEDPARALPTIVSVDRWIRGSCSFAGMLAVGSET